MTVDDFSLFLQDMDWKRLIVAVAACCFYAASHIGAEPLPVSMEDMNITPSPDSSMVAFTRGGDLWVRSTADSSETRLTFDGSDVILNGYASWVYYEEIFGRASQYRAFWWSPDSRRIAYYRFDNTQVPVFPIFSPFGQDGSLSLTRYPKAGQTNPSVRVGVAELATGKTVWADFDYSEDQYFGTPFWSPDSEELFVPREPRRQNMLDLYAVSAADGSRRQVYHEEYPTWVEWIDDMLFTEDGFYMARNFETGWEQIYFLGYDGTLERLTDGENWDITLLRADERKGDIWFTAKRDSRLHTVLYRLDRKGRITALTDPELNLDRVEISEDGKTFSGMVSTARQPRRDIEGRTDRCDWDYVSPEPDTDLSALPSPQIVMIQNDGYDLYALMSLPRDFDPDRRYPVVMQLYGGPGTPYVYDMWRSRDASDDWCFENGVIYIVCDPRSSGENGRKGMDEAFGRMTVVELGDYIAWAEWLQSLPYVDGSRIGVKGFSFGGTTTAMLVLRYPQYFRCGIAGGGVYDWTLYDTHYTERFMDTPQANPDGYAEAGVIDWVPRVFTAEPQAGSASAHASAPASASAPVFASASAPVSEAGPEPSFAADGESCRRPLPGALRLTHGTGDDNVHYQNTLLLMDALQKAGYQFEVMFYPDGMHGYRGYQGEHDKAAEAAFWTKWLLR